MKWILVLLLLSGCAANQQPEPSTWVGATEKDLTEAWGEPDDTMSSADSRMLKFVYGRASGPNVYLPKLSTDGPRMKRVYEDPPVCEIFFQVQSGMIVDWKWQPSKSVCRRLAGSNLKKKDAD